jgi:hypothetical protein
MQYLARDAEENHENLGHCGLWAKNQTMACFSYPTAPLPQRGRRKCELAQSPHLLLAETRHLRLHHNETVILGLLHGGLVLCDHVHFSFDTAAATGWAYSLWRRMQTGSDQFHPDVRMMPYLDSSVSRTSPRSLILGAAGRALRGRALGGRRAVRGRMPVCGRADLGTGAVGTSLSGSLLEIRFTVVITNNKHRD